MARRPSNMVTLLRKMRIQRFRGSTRAGSGCLWCRNRRSATRAPLARRRACKAFVGVFRALVGSSGSAACEPSASDWPSERLYQAAPNVRPPRTCHFCACRTWRINSQLLAKSSPYAGPSAGGEVARVRSGAFGALWVYAWHLDPEFTMGGLVKGGLAIYVFPSCNCNTLGSVFSVQIEKHA